jgi:hypothetical protein
MGLLVLISESCNIRDEQMNLSEIKTLLDKEVQTRNNILELSYEKPDPLFIATRYQDESIALICALFA